MPQNSFLELLSYGHPACWGIFIYLALPAHPQTVLQTLLYGLNRSRHYPSIDFGYTPWRVSCSGVELGMRLFYPRILGGASGLSTFTKLVHANPKATRICAHADTEHKRQAITFMRWEIQSHGGAFYCVRMDAGMQKGRDTPPFFAAPYRLDCQQGYPSHTTLSASAVAKALTRHTCQQNRVRTGLIYKRASVLLKASNFQ